MSDDPAAAAPPDPHGRDALEPTSLASGRLLIAAAAVFLLVAVSTAVLWGAYRWKVGHTPIAAARAFPSPRLETNQTPRASVSTSHGPGPYRLRPAELRTGEPRPAPDRLDAAMRAEAARGAQAYDPLPVSGAS